MGKAQRAHHLAAFEIVMVGTAQARLCPPYEASHRPGMTAKTKRPGANRGVLYFASNKKP